MIKKFIKLYTPFICAIISTIHGVLLVNKVQTSFYFIAQELTGNSILLLLYVLVHSKRMCKWYKLSIYSLLAIHVLNFAYHIKLIDVPVLLKLGICVNITSILFWLMFRITYKTAKVIHSACEHSEIE